MRRRWTFVLFSLFIVSCVRAGDGQLKTAKSVEVAEFRDLMKQKKGQVLDVRTAEEVSEGYIPGAVNFDFYGDSFSSQLDKLDKNKTVFVYCAAGGRSGKTLETLKKKGFVEIYDLSGGFNAWKEAGFEITGN